MSLLRLIIWLCQSAVLVYGVGLTGQREGKAGALVQDTASKSKGQQGTSVIRKVEAQSAKGTPSGGDEDSDEDTGGEEVDVEGSDEVPEDGYTEDTDVNDPKSVDGGDGDADGPDDNGPDDNGPNDNDIEEEEEADSCRPEDYEIPPIGEDTKSTLAASITRGIPIANDLYDGVMAQLAEKGLGSTLDCESDNGGAMSRPEFKKGARPDNERWGADICVIVTEIDDAGNTRYGYVVKPRGFNAKDGIMSRMLYSQLYVMECLDWEGNSLRKCVPNGILVIYSGPPKKFIDLRNEDSFVSDGRQFVLPGLEPAFAVVSSSVYEPAVWAGRLCSRHKDIFAPTGCRVARNEIMKLYVVTKFDMTQDGSNPTSELIKLLNEEKERINGKEPVPPEKPPVGRPLNEYLTSLWDKFCKNRKKDKE